MSNKMQRVKEVLNLENLLDDDSARVLKNATKLEEIIITVKKSNLICGIDFVYLPSKDKFIRMNNKEEETNSMKMYTVCKDRCLTPCFKNEIPIEDFITLVSRLVLKPKAIRLA